MLNSLTPQIFTQFQQQKELDKVCDKKRNIKNIMNIKMFKFWLVWFKIKNILWLVFLYFMF